MCKIAAKRAGHLTPALLLLILLFPNQVLNNHVSITIVFLVVVGENILTIGVIENVLIYEEEDERLWIGYPLNVCNILKDRDLQALVGRAEFDVSASNWFLRPSHDRRLLCGFEVEAFGAQCQDDRGVCQVFDSHSVSGAIARSRFLIN